MPTRVWEDTEEEARAPRIDWVMLTLMATTGLDSSLSTLDQRMFCLYVVLCISKNTKDYEAIDGAAKLYATTKMDPVMIDAMTEVDIKTILRGSGYEHINAVAIKEMARYMIKHGRFPDSTDEMMGIKGCGQKMANCFGNDVFQTRDSFGVDIHVARISYILSWWTPQKLPKGTHDEGTWLKNQINDLVANLKAWVPLHLWARVNLVFGSWAQMLTQSAVPSDQPGNVKDMRRLFYLVIDNRLFGQQKVAAKTILDSILTYYDNKHKKGFLDAHYVWCKEHHDSYPKPIPSIKREIHFEPLLAEVTRDIQQLTIAHKPTQLELEWKSAALYWQTAALQHKGAQLGWKALALELIAKAKQQRRRRQPSMQEPTPKAVPRKKSPFSEDEDSDGGW